MFLIRGSTTHEARTTYLVPDDELTVRHVRMHKPTGRVLGGLFTEVEAAGEDRTRLELSAPRENGNTVNAYGQRGQGLRYFTVAKCDVKKHVRKLASGDEAIVVSIDAHIAELHAQLREARRERAEFIKDAWRRAGKVLPLDLEERIES